MRFLNTVNFVKIEILNKYIFLSQCVKITKSLILRILGKNREKCKNVEFKFKNSLRSLLLNRDFLVISENFFSGRKILLPNRSSWAILQQSWEALSLCSWALFPMPIFVVVVVCFDPAAARHWWIWSGQPGLGIYLAITHLDSSQ